MLLDTDKLDRLIEQSKAGQFPLLGTESNRAWTAAKTIVTLRMLTKKTGTHTTRTQNNVLQSLVESDLIEVARILASLGWEQWL